MNMVSMAIYLQLYAKEFYIFFSHLKTTQSIFMKFSVDMGVDTLGSILLSKCSFYSNICHGLVLLWYTNTVSLYGWQCIRSVLMCNYPCRLLLDSGLKLLDIIANLWSKLS